MRGSPQRAWAHLLALAAGAWALLALVLGTDASPADPSAGAWEPLSGIVAEAGCSPPPRWRRIDPAPGGALPGPCTWRVERRGAVVHAAPVPAIGDDPLPVSMPSGSATEGLAGHRHVQAVPGGWLVAFNAGEFGAGVWWVSSDGSRRSWVGGEHVHGFVVTAGVVVAATGLCHMGIETRSVHRFAPDPDGVWRPTLVATLPGCAAAVAEERPGRIIVAAGEKLVRVTLDGETTTLGPLVTRPSSLAAGADGTVFVGAYGGIARLSPPLYREDVFVPPTCTTRHLRAGEPVCSCDPGP